jgi:hypothetical protein
MMHRSPRELEVTTAKGSHTNIRLAPSAYISSHKLGHEGKPDLVLIYDFRLDLALATYRAAHV